MNEDVLILCGGLGKRLRSVTGENPKVMAEINGEPFLDLVIKYLCQEGAKRIILCAGYKAEALKEYYTSKFNDIEILFSIEPEPLGTGGAFKYAEKLVKSDRFFGLNGDCFSPNTYQKFLDYHITRKAKASLTLVKVENNTDYGIVDTNENDEVLAFREKEVSVEAQYINAGIYLFEREVLQEMPEGAFSIEYDFFPKLIGKGFYGYKIDVPFIDIGVPERFDLAQTFLKGVV